MKYTVVKLGGSVLTGPLNAQAILDLLAARDGQVVVAVSALKGVTARLIRAARDRRAARGLAVTLRDKHRAFALSFCPPPDVLRAAIARIDELCGELVELLYADDASPDRRAYIRGFGERLAAVAMVPALAALGRRDSVVLPASCGGAAAAGGGAGLRLTVY